MENSRRSTWPGLGRHSLYDKCALNTLLCAKGWPGLWGLSSEQDRCGPCVVELTDGCSGGVESNALHRSVYDSTGSAGPDTVGAW